MDAFNIRDEALLLYPINYITYYNGEDKELEIFGILEVDEYDMNIYRPLSNNIEKIKRIINNYCQKQHKKEMYRFLQKIRFVY